MRAQGGIEALGHVLLPSISQPPLSLLPPLPDKKWAQYKLHLNEVRGRGRGGGGNGSGISNSLCRVSSWVGIGETC